MNMAEREGFEPPDGFPSIDFESTAFDQLSHLSECTLPFKQIADFAFEAHRRSSID